MKKTTHYKGHRWTNDELKILMQMWQGGYKLSAIAEELNISQTGLLKQVQRLRKNGIPLERRKNGHQALQINRSWTQGQVEYLIRRRNEKATSEEIAVELGRTPNAIDAMIGKLRKEGVQVTMRGNGVSRLWDPESLKAVAINLKS